MSNEIKMTDLILMLGGDGIGSNIPMDFYARQMKHPVHLSVEHVYLWRPKDFTSITVGWGSRLKGRHIGAPMMDGHITHDVAERDDIPSDQEDVQLVDESKSHEDREECKLMDILKIPDAFITDRDDSMKQSTILYRKIVIG
ncbi:hypothetical protein BC826DRAFT_973776 [Russula brevipes]|nr:hypothetical protein BC826DRAFT_973776 [Russula brevipes]